MENSRILFESVQFFSIIILGLTIIFLMSGLIDFLDYVKFNSNKIANGNPYTFDELKHNCDKGIWRLREIEEIPNVLFYEGIGTRIFSKKDLNIVEQRGNWYCLGEGGP